MLKKFHDFFHKADVYSLAIRKRGDGKDLLFEGDMRPFDVLPISKDEWYADPIVFTYNGTDYIFCEIYDRDKDLGFIGVSTIIDGKFSKPKKVLDVGSHLSYPCVFELGGTIYMIPETTMQKNIGLYKAVDFPYAWEFLCELYAGDEFADSTIYINGEKKLLLTFQHFNGNGSITKTRVFDAKEIGKGLIKEIESIKFDYNDYSRGGGSFFEYKGSIYRPAQICTKEYGYALNFMKVDCRNGYQEEIIASVYPEDMQFKFKKKIKGVHTYALTKEYEIVDVKFDDPRLKYQIRRLVRFIIRKLKGDK